MLRDNHCQPPWILIVIAGAALSIGLFFIGRYTARETHVSTSRGCRAKVDHRCSQDFDNLSRDADNAFFAEGVQDEILTRLASIKTHRKLGFSRYRRSISRACPTIFPRLRSNLA